MHDEETFLSPTHNAFQSKKYFFIKIVRRASQQPRIKNSREDLIEEIRADFERGGMIASFKGKESGSYSQALKKISFVVDPRARFVPL